MKIAIVSPSPVPFTIGGAENLSWGLLEHINQHTSHQAELFKLPSPEYNFWEIISSYQAFSQLDLLHFDLVISTKYPSWMVAHPHHICYLLHRLRGLYDTYHFTGRPIAFETSDHRLAAILDFIYRNQENPNSLTAFFECLNQLRSATDIDPTAFQFPGPFIREIVRYLDGIGLCRQRIKRYLAISRNVVGRQDYFPSGVRAESVYPPSKLRGFHFGKSEYLFTVSRLDGAKRVGLLIEAMKASNADIELRIAGTGPDVEQLRAVAGDDGRIKFLGFVNDQELIDLYADALAVPYLPYDEDYGLVTIEAMMCGKPVLTTTDAGGPNEFVTNGQTGFSVPPVASALAEKIDYLNTHRKKAAEMGQKGYELVRDITWENTVSRLLDETPPRPRPVVSSRRPKLTVTSTFPIYPVQGGGQYRIFHLYRHLARQFQVELVTITNYGEPPFDEDIAPGLREIRIPKSSAHHQAECEYVSRVQVPVTDVVMPKLYHLTPDYMAALRQSMSSSQAVVVSHPYLLSAVQEIGGPPIWHESHNVEYELKSSIIPHNETGRELIELTRQVEAQCCHQSALVFACSYEDAQKLSELYQVKLDDIVVVPNGVNLVAIHYVDPGQRRRIKREGGDESYMAAFLGSWHGPNLDAVSFLISLAEEIPEVNFIVLGSSGLYFKDHHIPSNMRLTGVVDERTKDRILSSVDLALNPMQSGSGTNIKMLEYMAQGIPVLSTPTGIRGLAITPGKHALVSELADFAQTIRELTHKKSEDWIDQVTAARRHVAFNFDWAAIAQNFMRELKKRPEIFGIAPGMRTE
ncbi:MAG: glycosyltransferase family 4 protein [Deltaproteobacteria bacterium]|nr:glycosyltransferase family 4 protein [Deltaproteobacteria bacterium]